MCKSGFSQNRKPTKCVAFTGSKNVGSKSVYNNFKFAIAACVAANGFVILSVFFVPSQRLNLDVMDKCIIEGSVISVAHNGFMIYRLFIKWLVQF